MGGYDGDEKNDPVNTKGEVMFSGAEALQIARVGVLPLDLLLDPQANNI